MASNANKAMQCLVCLLLVSKMAATSQSLTEATANWAVEMLRRVGGPTKDAFFSPASIAVALGMAYAGAEGNTRRQFNDVLFKGLTENEVHEGFSRIVTSLNAPKQKYELSIANKFFVQAGFTLLSDYTDILKNYYQSTMNTVDFLNKKEEARSEINGWVEKKTKKYIKDLIGPEDLDVLTRLVLVNAIYFKGQWKYAFEPKNTYNEVFYCSPMNKQVICCSYVVLFKSTHARNGVQIYDTTDFV